MPKPNGRPSKFSAEVAEKICGLLRAGNYVDVAAVSAGISKQTLHVWLKKHARFRDAVSKAVADSEATSVVRIASAASKGEWKASAWHLERRSPKRWGPRIALTVTEEIEGFLAFAKEVATPEVYAEFLRISIAWGERTGLATQRSDLGEE